MHRILCEQGQSGERRRQATHPAKAVPELVATAPSQVFTWDITKAAGPVKGVWYHACYSAAYRLATAHSHVIYESHLELARLLMQHDSNQFGLRFRQRSWCGLRFPQFGGPHVAVDH